MDCCCENHETLTCAPIAYGSPISLGCDFIPVCSSASFVGHNRGSKYNEVTKNFEIRDIIVLTLESESEEALRYQFYEYHFHVPGDHELFGKKYDAELHYSLVKLNPDEEYLDLTDAVIPGPVIPGNRNIAGIARFVNGG